MIHDTANIYQPDRSTSARHVYVVEDEEVQRFALHKLLESAGFEVSSFLSADALLQHLAELPGGCVVTDLIMPGKSGLELQDMLLDRWNDFRLILMSAMMDTSTTVKATRAGAIAVLDKPLQYEVLRAAVEEALQSLRTGQPPHCQMCRTKRAGGQPQRPADQTVGGFQPAQLQILRDRYATLSERETQVAKHVCEGMTNRAIGSLLGISSRTVEKHRAKAMKKLGARTLPDFALVMAAIRELDANT